MSRLTKREWRDVVLPRPRNADEIRVFEAIERMVDNGETWAPEPVTEGDVRRWLYGPPGSYDRFREIDLGKAMEACRNHGGRPHLSNSDGGWWVTPRIGLGLGRRTASLATATRIFATWAYAQAHDADVTHLMASDT